MTPLPRTRKETGFTLVEMLVSVAVLALLLMILTQMVSGLHGAIQQTSNEIQEFQQARDAFESMTRRIGQATLNAYDDRDPRLPLSTGSNAYIRASELRFISGLATGGNPSLLTTGTVAHPTDAIFFQAPLGYAPGNTNYAGLINLLNTCGYYIEWNSDQNANLRPPFLNSITTIHPRWRYRLMELIEPSQNLSIYNYTSGSQPYASGTGTVLGSISWNYNSTSSNGLSWFQNALTETPAPVHSIAENVIYLALLPMVAPRDATLPPGGAADGTSTDIAPNYLYDTSPQAAAMPPPYSQNRLPPMVYVLMIAVEERSFARYQTETRGNSSSDPSSGLGLTNILQDATYTTRAQEISNITAVLTTNHVQYRIFTAAVPLSPN